MAGCAGTLLTIYKKGADGHTAWHRLRGKPWRKTMLQFGECIDFKQKTKSKLQNKCRPGVFLGVKLDSTELIVADGNGVYLVNDYLRVPQEHKFDAAMLQSVRGTP